jgi:hypothetical protein
MILSLRSARGTALFTAIFGLLLSAQAFGRPVKARAARPARPAPPSAPVASHETAPAPAPPRSRTTARVLFPLNVGPAVVTSTVSNLATPLRAMARREKPSDTWPVAVIGAPVIGPITGVTGALQGYWFWELWDWEVTRVNDTPPGPPPLPRNPPREGRKRAAR